MAAYQSFVSSRTTTPDTIGMLAALRSAVAPEVGVLMVDFQHFTLKKTAAWTPADVTAAQNVLDTFAALTPALAAQHMIDNMDVPTKAQNLWLLDQLNIVRAALPVPLPAITPAQAIAGIRAKAGTL